MDPTFYLYRKYRNSISNYQYYITLEDKYRIEALNEKGWDCIRISDIHQFSINLPQIGNSYFSSVLKAADRKYDAAWTRALQIALSPIGVARLEKTLIEALISGTVDYHKEHLDILVVERDVPCAVLAFRELSKMFNNLATLSEDYKDVRFPKVRLDIVTTPEFKHSPLHKTIEGDDSVSVNIFDDEAKVNGNKQYDIVVDMAVMRRAGAEDKSFSKHKCVGKGYFYDYSGINVPLVAVCNVPPVAQCNVPPQKWLQ